MSEAIELLAWRGYFPFWSVTFVSPARPLTERDFWWFVLSSLSSAGRVEWYLRHGSIDRHIVHRRARLL